MIRRAVIAVLTVAAVGTGAGWIVSHCCERAKTVFEYEPTDASVVQLLFDQGSFLIRYFHDVEGTEISSRGPVFGKLQCRTGMADRRHDRGSYCRFVAIGSPFWLPFFLFAAYPAVAFIRGPLRRWHRRRRGLCINCAYNLTGNVSGVCPECGKKV